MRRVLPAVAVTFALLLLTLSPLTAQRRSSATKARITRSRAPTAAVADARWSERTLKSLTLHDLIAQLVIVPCYGDNPSSESDEFKKFAHLVRDTHVGGMIVLNRAVLGRIRNAEPYAMAVFFNRMQKLAPLPLLMGGDFERGASMRVSGTAKFPHNMAYTAAHDLALTRFEGAQTAREARAMGVQWVFAPDADVNNNPDNPIINIRSYGEDPAAVGEQVRAYIEGAHSSPKSYVLTSAKHFPGHGDTAVDSHMGLASITVTKQRMDAVELPPFRAAIEAGTDSIMTAHMAVPALEPKGIPATVSPKILTGLLRQELGFKGIITTDAMDMQGLASQFPSGEAAIRAIEAGADVLLMPLDADKTIAAVMTAVNSGRLTRARLETSVKKLLDAKARLGLPRERLVDPELIADVIDSREAAMQAQQVANKSVTLVKNSNDVLPLKPGVDACVFVLAEGRFSQGGRQMMEELRRRGAGPRSVLLDPTMSDADLAAAAQKTSDCKVISVMAFTSVAAYRGNVALAGSFSSFVDGLVKSNVPVVLFSIGNPYLLRAFPTVTAYVATYSTAPTAEIAAVRALFGEIAIGGRLPVSIPGLAKVGDGIAVPAVTNR